MNERTTQFASEVVAPRPRNALLLQYAIGSIGTGVYSTVPSILLLYFLTEQLHLPIALASLAILIPKLGVILVDPMIGAWSDRSPRRQGKRSPFLLVGAMLSALSFVALFNAPMLGSQMETFAAATGLYFVASLSYSVFSVPYVTLPAEMSDAPDVRTRIIGWRMTFVFAGVLIGAAAPPVLVEAFGGGRAGYGWMALLIAGVCAVTMLSAAWASRSIVSAPRRPSARLWQALAGVIAYRDYRSAALFYAFAMAASGAYTASLPYFVTRGLGLTAHALSTFLVVQLTVSIVMMPLWARAGALRSRTQLLARSVAISAVGCLVLYLAPRGTLGTVAFAGAAISGIGLAGTQVGSFAWLADLIRNDTDQKGGSREALLTGVWTATERTALAFGPFLCALVMASAGFDREQTVLLGPAAEHAVRIAVAWLPACLLAMAAGVLVWGDRARRR